MHTLGGFLKKIQRSPSLQRLVHIAQSDRYEHFSRTTKLLLIFDSTVMHCETYGLTSNRHHLLKAALFWEKAVVTNFCILTPVSDQLITNNRRYETCDAIACKKSACRIFSRGCFVTNLCTASTTSKNSTELYNVARVVCLGTDLGRV